MSPSVVPGASPIYTTRNRRPSVLNAERPSISIVIASIGRPVVLAETIDSLQRQTLRPERIIVVVPSPADLPSNNWGDGVQFIVGSHGSASQRNDGIEAVPDSVWYVGCFDDDFELKPDYLQQAVAFMNVNVAVIGISGRLLADGGITRPDARQLIEKCDVGRHPRGMFFSRGKHHILHGCNMIIRRPILNYERFDENLPLYSYAEDYDLSIRLERYGIVGRFSGCIGVHLQTPSGRVRETLRGYSLIANNWYFLEKGVTHLPLAIAWARFWLVCVGNSVFKSLWKHLTGDRTLDWRERLRGHLLALTDILSGRCHPGRIKEL